MKTWLLWALVDIGDFIDRRVSIRWHIAEFFNRYPDTCWAQMAIWALFPDGHDFYDVLDFRHSTGECTKESSSGFCYCGKLRAEQ